MIQSVDKPSLAIPSPSKIEVQEQANLISVDSKVP